MRLSPTIARIALCAGTAACWCNAARADDSWPIFNVQRIGLYGPTYNVAGSFSSQIILQRLGNGQCIGEAPTFTAMNSGKDAWWWDGRATRRVGLTGGAYSRSDGTRDGRCDGILDGTSPYGTATVFDGAGLAVGSVAWIDTGAGAVQIGLDGPTYIGLGGKRMTGTPSTTFVPGQLIGYTVRYEGEQYDRGYAGWLWSNGHTFELGLGGTEFPGVGWRRMVYGTPMPDGQIHGTTVRYTDDGMEEDGRRMWIWTGTQCVPVGLDGPEYRGAHGFAYSSLEPSMEWPRTTLNGYTYTISGERDLIGVDAWVWDGQQTVRMGPQAPEYRGANGLRSSHVIAVDRLGNWTGVSQRMDGPNQYTSFDAWVKQGDTYRLIGLTGPFHVGTAGYHYHQVLYRAPSGLVVGRTGRVQGAYYLVGWDYWTWDGQTVTPVGPIGFPYDIPETGEAERAVTATSAGGLVAGRSNIYSGAVPRRAMGEVAWLWDGSQTRTIGLIGSEYVSIGGYQSNQIEGSQGEQFLGKSVRYVPSTDTRNGQDLWIADATSTRQVGLTGPEFRSNSGYQFSVFSSAMGPHDSVRGWSTRVRPDGAAIGSVPWVFDGVTTHRLGLETPAHHAADGSVYHQIDQVDAAGRIFGRTRRYNGGAVSLGDEAWYYDAANGGMHAITQALPVSVIDSSNFSTRISWISEDGFVFGNYEPLNNGDGYGFVFRPDLGAKRLEDLVAGTASTDMWSYLWATGDATVAIDEGMLGSGIPSPQEWWETWYPVVLRHVGSLCPADIGVAGGVAGRDAVLDNNDFVAFIGAFFSHSTVADVGTTGGSLGADGQFDNNDFIAYIGLFFTGCG